MPSDPPGQRESKPSPLVAKRAKGLGVIRDVQPLPHRPNRSPANAFASIIASAMPKSTARAYLSKLSTIVRSTSQKRADSLGRNYFQHPEKTPSISDKRKIRAGH